MIDWSHSCASSGAVVLVHPAPTEQGYAIRTAGTRRRVPADFDGLTLIRMTAAPKVKEMQSPSWDAGQEVSSPPTRR
ncbi:type I-E CRISPR-associated endoribonuclease Cas2 [Streptomyces californicus]|uniref:type I-E CRISPR-associated endoribonuclease Cas2 n=1 Tax=Streptomyces californicus TaxID=67351 RepID=UPI0037AA2CEC